MLYNITIKANIMKYNQKANIMNYDKKNNVLKYNKKSQRFKNYIDYEIKQKSQSYEI